MAKSTGYTIDFFAATPDAYPTLTEAKYLASYGAFPTLGRVDGSAAQYLPGTEADLRSLAPQKDNPALGQIVVWDVVLDVDAKSGIKDGAITITLDWGTTTTSGANYGFDTNRGVVAAFVDNSARGTADTGSLATVSGKSWTVLPTDANGNAWLQGDITVKGLDAGDHVTLELWTVLRPGSSDKFTGVVHSQVASAKRSDGTAIDVGTQTIPLKVQGYGDPEISGTVFEDKNSDGTFGSGEARLAGQSVQLLNAAGTVVTSATTDSSGNYSLSAAPGTYSVKFVTPAGYSLSPQDKGSDDTLDSDANPATGTTTSITIASGQSVTDVDAGLWKAASITGLAFTDTNGDGIQGTGEVGIAGQSVQLLNAVGSVVATTTTTGSSGAYSFGNVTPGTYQMQFVAVSGISFTTQDQGSNDAIDSDVGSTGRSAAIILTSGQTVANVSAGSFAPATITGRAFTDLNSDGIRQTGEAVLPSITAQLLNAAGTIGTNATTDSSGNYSLFAAPGTYSVKFVTPAGYSLSPQDKGSDDTLDSDANPATGTTTSITVASGQSVTNVDAGLWQNDGQSGGSTSSGSTVYGSSANDLFHATDGQDLFYGNGGADWFDGGAGEDILFGADQADTMLGGAGNDTTYGAAGADLIQGGDGADRLYAGGGDDTVQGDDPTTLPLGSNYDDLIEAGAGNDLIFGGAGNDEMQGEGDDDTVAGGIDNGRLVFADPAHPVANAPIAVVIGDNLYGNGGRDTFLFTRGDGVDMLWDFDAAQDIIQISGYSRSNIAAVTFVTSVVNHGRSNGYPLDAGSHEKLALILNASGDAIIFNDFANRASERLVIRFDDGWFSAADLYARATPGGGSHQLPDPSTGVPGGSGGEGGAGGNAILHGTEAADSLTAYGWNNRIDAGAGNDTINGGEGNAVIDAGDGNNVITVGGWNNTVLAGTGSTRLSGPQGNTSVHFGNGDHFVQLGGYVNMVVLGIGDSVVDAGQSNSSVKIAGGNNIVVARGWSNQIQTGDGNDNISGIAGNSMVEAGGGDNRVTAAGSSNLITTGDGRDVIFAGDDTAMVRTGGGDDTVALQSWGNHLWAGSGNDVVLLGAGDGDGSIDGEAGTDTVIVTGSVTEYRFGVAGSAVYINGPGAKSYELRDVELIAFHGGADGTQTLPAVLAQAGLQQMAAQTANGVSSFVMPDLYSGPVAYLQYQLLGSDGGEAVASTANNDFLNLLGGDDAAIGGAGDDVLDGGTGSNFLTGGTGRDVFFIDGRSGQSTWSTIADWEAGEQLSIWGWHPGTSRVNWEDMAGTAGYQGATLHLDFDANGSWDASVTWSGVARSQLPTPHEYDGLLWFT